MKRLIGIILLGSALSFTVASCSSAEAAAKADPSKQISVQARFDHDKVGNSELKGAIFNMNNDVDFEDIVLKVDFYNKAGGMIGSRSFVVKEKINPGESEKFKLEFRAPKDTDYAQWSVVGGEAD
jgi:uncharacterized membrane protein